MQMSTLKSSAPAKINLTLRIGRRREDGYHEIESLIAFADIGDALVFVSGGEFSLLVDGPTAGAAGPNDDNLVLKAARKLESKFPDVARGKFNLTKNLPAGAGLGGGSSDAAAALRLLAEASGIAADDPRVIEAARETGADVLVCLDPKARFVSGVGDKLSKPLKIPALSAMLVYPGVPVPTALVYQTHDRFGDDPATLGRDAAAIPLVKKKFMDFLQLETNDLTKAARAITPLIASAHELIDEVDDAILIRMSGSGSAVFAVYEDLETAEASAEMIREERPHWWVRTTTLR